jgi:pectate lyase
MLAGWIAKPSAAEALSPKLPSGKQRAFPTAEGFGAAAVGGRAGKIIYVTTLNEGGSGSLRACMEATGPRNCVFRTGGTIILNSGPIIVTNPFVTIAGETAPGGGIAIRNGRTQVRPSIEIRTHDVIIRHLRLRPGPHSVPGCCSGGLGLYTPAAHDIMLDHISASWGSDETVDSEEASNFTWQWGILGEPLLRGGPNKRNRARNMLLTKSGDLTIHHTLFAQGIMRNPQVDLMQPGAVADVVNNVMHSRRWQYVVLFEDRRTHVRANVVGNFKTAGENLDDDHMVFLWTYPEGKGYSIYLSGNYDETFRPDSSSPEWLVLPASQRGSAAAKRFSAPPVRTSSAQQAYEDVLANAGATKPRRDAVDKRLVEEVIARTGNILRGNPSAVGGWPQLAAGVPYSDSDGDGIEDEWESRHGLDAAKPIDGTADSDGDGWTNFEEFLHELAGDVPAS